MGKSSNLSEGIAEDVFEGLDLEDVVDHISCGEVVIKIARPKDMDLLIEVASKRHDFESSRYMPYWASVWPVAHFLASFILKWDGFSKNRPKKVLELGCGLGVCGIAALMRGQSVTFSDYDKAALRYAAENAALNGFSSVGTLPLNWLHPPSDQTYDVLIGSDLTFVPELVPHLVRVFDNLLSPEGIVILADQNRMDPKAFSVLLSRSGFRMTRVDFEVPEHLAWNASGNLYEINRT